MDEQNYFTEMEEQGIPEMPYEIESFQNNDIPTETTDMAELNFLA